MEFGNQQGIYKNVDVLNPEATQYRPDGLPEREDELSKIHSALRHVTLPNGSPQNILVYGPTGQGKTVGVDIKTNQLVEWADGEDDIDITVLNVSCKGAGKSWSVLSKILKQISKRGGFDGTEYESNPSPTGRTRDVLFNMVVAGLENIGGIIILVLDEIDGITEDDYVLYEFPRLSLENGSIGVIGITNDYTFHNNLDADVRSSLGDREAVFTPYNADQLRNILSRRAALGIKDTWFEGDEKTHSNLQSDVLDDGVIPLCAALSGQDTGDARQAIRLFSSACDSALDNGSETVTEMHVHIARQEIEETTIAKAISGETVQRKLTLLSVLIAYIREDTPVETRVLFEIYKDLADMADTDSYMIGTFRRKLEDLSHGNIIKSEKYSRGKDRGVTNRYSLVVDPSIVAEKLLADSRLSDVSESVIPEGWVEENL